METMTITIKSTPKVKQLVGFIHELVKEGDVEIKKDSVYKDVQQGIRDIKAGRVKPISELFK